MLVKIAKYIVFSVYRRSYLICPPVIVAYSCHSFFTTYSRGYSYSSTVYPLVFICRTGDRFSVASTGNLFPDIFGATLSLLGE